MEETDGKFNILSYSSAIHFDREVLSWDMHSSAMYHVNIMSPNSIASWHIVSHDHSKYEDYMEISFSEADCKSSVIVVRGMLNYILQVLGDSESVDWESKDLGLRLGTAPACVLTHLREHCEAYGKLRPKT